MGMKSHPSLAEELPLAIDSFCEGESQSSWRMWPSVILPCSSGWPCIQELMTGLEELRPPWWVGREVGSTSERSWERVDMIRTHA